MAWIEVHQSLPTHAKTVEAAALLDVPEVQLVGHLVCLWLWALDNAQEGLVRVDKPIILAKAARWAGEPGRFVDALLGAGFLDESGAIHDWDEYAGRLMERRERIKEQTRGRVQAYRERRRLSSIDEGNADVTRYDRYGNAPVTVGNAPTVPNLTVPTVKESLTTPVDRGPAREADASAPLPAVPVAAKVTRGNVRVAGVIDALRAEGMTGVLTGRDKRALKETECDPKEVAALYAAIYRGEHGDSFMHDNLSVALCLEKMPGWLSAQEGHQAPTKQTGAAKSATSKINAVFEGALNGHAIGSERGRAAMGVQQTRGGLPRQLPG
jgi:hypothetical protein